MSKVVAAIHITLALVPCALGVYAGAQLPRIIGEELQLQRCTAKGVRVVTA
jgi:hypothetical protein